MLKHQGLNEIKKDINQTLRFNIEENIRLVTDIAFTWLKIQLFSSFNEKLLKTKVMEYLFLLMSKHLNSIKNERRLLALMKEVLSNETEDAVIDLLTELDEFMELRYTDYDTFLANYDELIFSGFTKYNYKHISRTECFLDEKKVEDASKILTKEKR